MRVRTLPALAAQVLLALTGVAIVGMGARARRLMFRVVRERDEAVTARLRAECALEGVADAVITIDDEGRVAHANDAAVRLVDRPRTDLVGRPWEDSWTVFGDRARSSCREAMTTKSAKQFEDVNDDLDRTLIVRATPMGDGGLSVQVSDVSDARRTSRALVERERELRSERARATRPAPAAATLPDDASAAQLSKDAFLSVLSHELRTSLNAVLGWSEVLRMSTHDPEQVATAADVIKRNARAQASLISSLLDANALASGRVQLDLHDVDVTESARKAIEAFRPRADAAGVALAASLPGSALLLADAARVDQVLGYLLEHALQATPAGGTITVSVTSSPGGDLDIAVTDTGPGIPADLLSSVFETFTNPTAARRATSQRLGLAIARYVAELHGGGASASSEGMGMGSTITVRLSGDRRESRTLLVAEPASAPFSAVATRQ